MVVSRQRPKGARRSFGLIAFLIGLMPVSIGYQDLGSLIARQTVASDSWRQHILASPFGTIHAATFSFPRPVGTAIPRPIGYQLASFDPRSLDVTGSIPRNRGLDPLDDSPAMEFPTVDRRLKGDLLVPRAKQQQPTPETPGSRPRPARERDFTETAPDAGAERSPATDRSAALAPLPDIQPSEMSAPNAEDDADIAALDFHVANPAMQTARLFFGSEGIASMRSGLEPWGPGEAPVLVSRSPDLDIKLSALIPDAPGLPKQEERGAETIAPKGEVTGPGRRPMTPAERLGLTDPKLRAKHERCLADAIYYESRGEQMKGQEAVAQVVLNRAFSGKYPDTVCGVVYQDSNRYLRCQFTFACEGKKLIVDEPDMWEQAKRIAREMLDGKIYVPEVGKATHYHAYWVRPSWVNEMKRLYKYGVHTFYRPRAWGDGSDQPGWGSGAGDRDMGPQASVVETPAATPDNAAAARM